MATYAGHREAHRRLVPSHAAAVQLRWLGAGLTLGFAVPYVLSDVLALQRDVYYGVYSLFAVGL